MIFIDNLVDGLLLAAKSKKVAGETYWIADECPYETLEIYRTIADYFGISLTPKFVPRIVSKIMEKADLALDKMGVYEINMHVAGEMTRNIACSIEKARKQLGYHPRYDLKKGMEKTIQLCQEAGLV